MPITDKLTSIANAIREKGGTTEKLTLDAMPNAIAALSTGGSGEDVVPNPLSFGGVCSYLFYGNRWKWILDKYSDRIQTENVNEAKNMFAYSTLPNGIPFAINLTTGASCENMFQYTETTLPDDFFLQEGMNGKIGSISYMFSGATIKKIPSLIQAETSTAANARSWLVNSTVEEIGDLTLYTDTFGELFRGANYLRHIPNITFTNPKLHTYKYATQSNVFMGCYSVRTIPETVLKEMYNTEASGSSYWILKNTFNSMYALDEIVGLSPRTATATSNMFEYTFQRCYRLKNIIFDTQDDGTPYTVEWKNQTINLSDYVGWAGAANADRDIVNYNSGITAEDEDNDWSNNPNYWSRQFVNSRFNHNSAVNLINSLPDTSAYLATQSGATNTIKFKTNAGSATPGGGVNALTEEEIAVAAAKGWSIGYTT